MCPKTNNMSTTFGVKIIGQEEAIEVAFRNSTGIKWTDDLAAFLPDDTAVIPLDNSAQGIHNIGDIKEAMRRKEKVDLLNSQEFYEKMQWYRFAKTTNQDEVKAAYNELKDWIAVNFINNK